jgi:hypothetical protein
VKRSRVHKIRHAETCKTILTVLILPGLKSYTICFSRHLLGIQHLDYSAIVSLSGPDTFCFHDVVKWQLHHLLPQMTTGNIMPSYWSFEIYLSLQGSPVIKASRTLHCPTMNSASIESECWVMVTRTIGKCIPQCPMLIVACYSGDLSRTHIWHAQQLDDVLAKDHEM